MNIQELITKYGIRHIYHFTDKRNLDLIRAGGGLFSYRELRRQNLTVAAPGGNDWSRDADSRSGVDEYVHLCYTQDHPMAYRAQQDGRIQDCKYLQIDSSIMTQPGVLYTSEVANKAGVKLMKFEDFVQEMDLEVLFTRTDWRRDDVRTRLNTARKYEILIPKFVPAQFIKNL